MFCREHGDETAGLIQWKKFLTSLQTSRFLRRDLSMGLVDLVSRNKMLDSDWVTYLRAGKSYRLL